MNIKTTQNHLHPESRADTVTLKETGNVLEIRYIHRNHGAAIQRLNKEQYCDKATGEVKSIVHHASRADDLGSVKQSLRKLRDLINTNLTKPSRVRWVTLTYAENMTDTKRLYKDYAAFWKDFQNYLAVEHKTSAEYIAVPEPQERGAWHFHCLFFFPSKAPDIPSKDLADLWGHGFVYIKRVHGKNNLGLYLTAYLSDMEFSKAIESGNASGQIKEKEVKDESGKRMTKPFVKGARLHLYPAGFNMFRCSSGIKKPTVRKMTEAKAQKIVGDAPLTYEKTVVFTDDDSEVKNFINYRQYNRARRKKQDG